MNIIGPNSNEIIFSRTAGDIVVTDIPSGPLFEVYFAYEGRRFGFEARAYNGKYTLHLSEVLKALEENTSAPAVPDGGCLSIYAKTLTVEFLLGEELEDSCVINWIPGYCKANSDDIEKLTHSGYWWTFRPQTAYTYAWSREILQLALPANSAEIEIYVDIHFAEYGKKRLLYKTVRPDGPTFELVAIDVSYKHIENLAYLSEYTDGHILAYDVTGVSDGVEDLPIGQRFIVAPKNRDVRGWYFRNSLGAFDTVYSFGSFARALESEAKTFTTNKKELELTNITKETFSVDTGYIKNEKELNLWYEFLRSTERYIVLNDNEVARIVVDESDSEKTLSEAGSISFRCRMSEEVEGYDFSKSRLEDFSDGFT